MFARSSTCCFSSDISPLPVGSGLQRCGDPNDCDDNGGLHARDDASAAAIAGGEDLGDGVVKGLRTRLEAGAEEGTVRLREESGISNLSAKSISSCS